MAEGMNYCPNCGAKLDPENNFCSNCGAGLNPSDADASSIRPSKDQNANRNRNPLIIALIVAVIVVGIAIIVTLIVINDTEPDAGATSTDSTLTESDADAAGIGAPSSPDTTDEPTQGEAEQALEETPASTQNEMSSSAASSSPKTYSQEDLDTYQTLLGYYDKLPDWLAQVQEQRSRFATDAVNPDVELRNADYYSAQVTLDNLWDDENTLKALDVPSDSVNYSPYLALRSCYFDLAQQMYSMVQGWKISIKHDDPQNYEEDIYKAQRGDMNDGRDRYMTDYEKSYKRAEPQHP